MTLLERDTAFVELTRLRALAEAGNGQVVFVCGEAGIGKTALLTEFLSTTTTDGVLRGYCDPLTTPSALGPVSEIWGQLSGAEPDPNRDRLFAAICSRLQQSGALTTVVIEDLHWADEATFDFVRYLGRRIAHTRCLMLATFRDDEVGAAHPLSRAIGDLSGGHVSRLQLRPLSLAAVVELAAHSGRDAARVFAVSGGNPFFVRELLSAPLGSVPATVRDSMLARLARCSASARELSEYVALSPGRMALELLRRLLGPSQNAIDEAIERGILTHDRLGLAYRHELARRAVEDSLPPARAQELNARILAALLELQGELGRIVHHARRAHDPESVLQYAPQAGRQAASVGAHREAAAHYAAALDFADRLERSSRVELYERHAYECYLTNQIDTAVASATRALELWRELGDRQAQGRTLRFLSRQQWFLGDRGNAERHALEAIAMHEAFPPDRDLAMAYSNRAQLAMLAGRVGEAVEFGERAVGIARSFGDVEIESHALNNIGAALLSTGDEQGRARLERSLAMAIEHDLHEHAARAYVNLATSAIASHDVERATRYLRDGIAYCEERDLDAWTSYLKVYRARFRLDRGEWAEAAREAELMLATSGSSAITRIPAQVVLAQVRMRRGEPGVDALLDEALASALPTGELQRIGRVCVARAEHAWYQRDLDALRSEAELGLKYAEGHRDVWMTGELLWLKSRVGPVDAPGDVAGPYSLAIGGDWRAAAAEFERCGMPYEQAVMLLRGDADGISRAAAIIERLGAVALLPELESARRVAAGRNGPITYPHGLTKREVEVLRLLGHGHTNAELADKLCLSTKTVDHHVSAILGKLQVRSRAHAVAAAHDLGLIGKT